MRKQYARLKLWTARTAARCEAALNALERRTLVRGAVFFAILLIIGGVMFLLNSHTPILMDDYDYLYSWETGERITGFMDALRSQLVHYQVTNGRLVTHTFVQTMLSMDKSVFNVVNTVMYLILLLEIYAIAKPKGVRFAWWLLLIAHLILFTMVPFFGMVFLWLTGSCNYLWGTVIALTPLLVLRSVRESGVMSKGIFSAAVCPVIGFFAGFTNENTACGMIAMVFVAVVIDWLEGKRPAKRLTLMWIGQCAGTLTMLLAPGNAQRIAKFDALPLPLEMLRRVVYVTAYGASYLGVLFAVTLLMMAALRGKSERIGYTGLLLFGALIASYAMVGSPVLSARTFTGVFALGIAALLVLAGDLFERFQTIGFAKLIALPALMVVLVYTGYYAIEDVTQYQVQWQNTVSTIENAAARGEERVEVSAIEAVSRFTITQMIEPQSTDWPNWILGKVFGIDIIGR